MFITYTSLSTLCLSAHSSCLFHLVVHSFPVSALEIFRGNLSLPFSFSSPIKHQWNPFNKPNTSRMGQSISPLPTAQCVLSLSLPNFQLFAIHSHLFQTGFMSHKNFHQHRQMRQCVKFRVIFPQRIFCILFHRQNCAPSRFTVMNGFTSLVVSFIVRE